MHLRVTIFEFRAVGSSANCAKAQSLSLNAAVAHQLAKFKFEVDAKIAAGTDKFAAILEVIRKDAQACKAIIFDGNGYSDDGKEALARGLDCETSVPVIFDAYLMESSIKMFEETGVMTEKELIARNEVKWDMYTKKIQIEARVLGDLAMNISFQWLPSISHRLLTMYTR